MVSLPAPGWNPHPNRSKLKLLSSHCPDKSLVGFGPVEQNDLRFNLGMEKIFMRARVLLFVIWVKHVSAVYDQTVLRSAAYICDGFSEADTLVVSRGGSGLDSFVGDNIVQELLYDPNCDLDSRCFSKNMRLIISTIVRAASGLITCIIVLLCFIFFSPCLCSRRCRRWGRWKRIKEHKHAGDFKPKPRRIIMIGVSIVAIAVLVDIGLIASQKNEVKSGLNAALCETYKFLNQTLTGGSAVAFDTTYGYSVEAQFPGLYNTSILVSNLTDLVAPNSTLMNSIDDLLNTTGLIEQELVTLQQWFVALATSLRANKAFFYHTCIFCTNFSTYAQDNWQYNPINPSMLSINNSLAAVLTMVRSQLVPLAVTGPDSLYSTLNATSDALSTYVDELTKLIDSSVLKNLSKIREIMNYFDIGIVALLCITTIPLVLLVVVVVRGLYYSAQDTYTHADHPPMKSTFVGVSLWITLVYTVIVFLVSGIILLGGYFMGSICLLMEDAGSVAAKLSFRFGSASVSETVVGITEQCLQESSDGDILSAILVSEESTARDKINALTSLSGQFGIIQEAVAEGGPSINLSTNAYINNLGRYVDSVGDLFLITEKTKRQTLLNTTDYKPTATSFIFKDNLTLGYEIYDDVAYSVPQCGPRDVSLADTPPGVLAMLSNYTLDETETNYAIPGFTETLTLLRTNGVTTGITTCPSPVNATLRTVPWGNILNRKSDIIRYNRYRCAVPNVTYNAATFEFNKNVTTNNCTQETLRDYMHNFGEAVVNQSIRVDEAVTANFAAIFDSVWSLIYDQLMQPIQEFGSSMNCQFISNRWNSLFASMCITFTPSLIKLGNTLFVLGFAGVFALIVEIIVWRHLKDNYCLWKDSVEDPEAVFHIHARPSIFANVRLSGLWNAWGSALFGRDGDENPTKAARAGSGEIFNEPADVNEPGPTDNANVEQNISSSGRSRNASSTNNNPGANGNPSQGSPLDKTDNPSRRSRTIEEE